MSNIISINRTNDRNAIADAFIAKARAADAWPTTVTLERGRTDSGLVFPGRAVVAGYESGKRLAHGVVGKKYTEAGVANWEATVRAAVEAGARPVGHDIMCGGGSVFARFEVDGDDGFKSYFHLLDDLTGTRSLQHFATLFRVICRNQQAQFSPHATNIRHTASITDRLEALQNTIDSAIQHTRSARQTYDAAREIRATHTEVEDLLRHLFPVAEDASVRTRNSNERRIRQVVESAALPINAEGQSLATIWNGLTHSIDYKPDGSARTIRDTADYKRTKAELHMLGARGDAVRKTYNTVTEIIAAGSIRQHLDNVAAAA